MKKNFWIPYGTIFLVFLYAWLVFELFSARQTDILLIISIVASTLSIWGAWYSFLKKNTNMYISLLLVSVFSLSFVYLAMVDVVNPELIGPKSFE